MQTYAMDVKNVNTKLCSTMDWLILGQMAVPSILISILLWCQLYSKIKACTQLNVSRSISLSFSTNSSMAEVSNLCDDMVNNYIIFLL
jgi:hypothetical protein